MALGKDSVDAFLTNLDQGSPDHKGPIGRLKEMNECVASKFTDPTPSAPAAFLVEPRKGFTELAAEVRDVNGIVLADGWNTPGFIGSPDNQLVAIDRLRPRVYSDDPADPFWVQHDAPIQTNVLREDVLVGGYGTSTTPDHAVIGDTLAQVYTQVVAGVPVLMFGVLKLVDGKPGPWIVPPYAFAAPTLTTETIVGHVLACDGRFWVILNDDQADVFGFYVFGVDGVQLDSATTPRLATALSPGYWDVCVSTEDPTVVLLVQPTDDGTVDDNVGVTITAATFDVDEIDTDTTTHAEINCSGPVTWFVNRSATDAHDYLGTRRAAVAELNSRFDVYQLDETITVTDQWTVTDDEDLPIDAFTGHIGLGEAPDYACLVVGYGAFGETSGPLYNPQSRQVRTYRINLATDSIVAVRSSHSQALVTRPMVNEGMWQVATFYQSGQGYRTEAPITPTITLGDYFVGSALQDLTVNPGDHVRGSPITVNSSKGIAPTGSGGSVAITGADTVAVIAASGISGIPDGTPLLEWTFANLTLSGSAYASFLTPAASSISAANHSWFVVQQVSTNVFRTLSTSVTGFTVGGGTFSATGTVSIIAGAVYNFEDLDEIIPPELRAYFILGELVVTGNDTPGNNVTASIYAVTYAGELPNTNADLDAIIVPATTQAFSFSGFTAQITPVGTNVWFLPSNTGAGVMVGGSLIVTDDVNEANNDSFEVTDYFPTGQFETANEVTLITEVFETNKVPTIQYQISPDQVEHTFFLQDLAAALAVNPQRFIGATLYFASGVHSSNTGTYRIIGWHPDLDGTIYTVRVVQEDNQHTQDLTTVVDAVVITFGTAAQAPFQPTYFLAPTEGTRPIVGCFDRLAAYNDWRADGLNSLHGHLSGVSVDDDGAIRFVATTRQQPVNTVDGSQVMPTNTVGVKLWALYPSRGFGFRNMIPGPLAVSFEKDAFPEDGFNLAPEAPWFIDQDEADAGQLALTPKTKYVYQFVDEAIDQQGNRIFSPPSPPLEVALTGSNNRVTIGGCLPTYWTTNPVPVAGHYGVTNRTSVVRSVFRTSVRNGTTTVTRYRLTSNLNPNALAPIADDNESGFTFEGSTFTYVDQNADEVILGNDAIYSGLPRFGAPAFSQGCTAFGRQWVIAPDGSLQFSTAETEGVRQFFTPLFRIAPPPDDRPVAVAPLERYLVVLCSKSVYWLPAVQMPNSLGQGGTIPSLVKTKFTNGCTGPAIATGAGVVYASSAGGLWLVNESLDNLFFSRDVRYFDGNNAPASMAIDKNQRLAIATADGSIPTYDFVTRLWSLWTPFETASGITVHGGRFAYRAAALVAVQGAAAVVDTFGALDYPILPDVTITGLMFGGVRHFARLRKIQFVGQFRNTHYFMVEVRYPDDFPGDPMIRPAKLVTAGPLLHQTSLSHPKAAMFEVRVRASFDDGVTPITPGESFALEVLSCEVGLDTGLKSIASARKL